ncbi:unnamed protein product [Phaedon cochleariae]|uniref:Condensin-2 complex subunit H2 C-terminal domain-containing protein n=1 Tax=Phaedon cochleariae TaxID=80249 RepID=A0A9P0GU71_PHACE|nr:unnamed protein product [Phaedon cochleariae]
MDMEEEECDYSTPIGQIIKQMNALSKKPKLDKELGLALDLFHDKISKQQVYLKNGIFNINFAEAALFLQSCADLYGKKIDLLWDQLLEFHTRLIEYDCEHEKEKGKKMNTEVIQQLEERRNRYKRKKKFKLVLSCDDNIDGFIFDKPLPSIGNTFESDDEVYKKWKKLEWQSAKITSIPNAVYKQQLTMYRMKNYYIMKHQNYDVFDIEDGEFNIKYGRIPGWHFIQHLFEYNEKGLLPDKNNLIATLRLGSYLRLAFMRDNKIPMNAKYPLYRDQYLAYKKKYFEEEAQKWQNMPLDTMEDLHKQLQFLAQKEREALRHNNPHSNNPSPVPNQISSGIIHCCDDGTENDKSRDHNDLEKLIDESDHDSLFELSFNCDDPLRSDLCIRLERLSTDIINNKLRNDSGCFERVSDSGDDLSSHAYFTGDGNNNEIQIDSTENSGANKSAENGEGAILGNCEICPEKNDNLVDLPASVDSLVTQPTIIDSESSKENTALNVEPCLENALSDHIESSKENTGRHVEPCLENAMSDHDKENVDPNSADVDNSDTRSVISDHSYCMTPLPNRKVLEENNNGLRKRNAKKDIMSPFVSSLTMVIPRAVRTKIPKENILKESKAKGQENDPSPSKRRKMSQKQLEKLVDKMVVLPTVKENKFEHFFSKNYQPQLGEGEIEEMEYESESDAEDNFVAPLPVDPLPPSSPQTSIPPITTPHKDDNVSVFSDHNYSHPAEEHPQLSNDADAQSVFSDHNYSQLPDPEQEPEPADDSGFCDGTLGRSVNESDVLDSAIEDIGGGGDERNVGEVAEAAGNSTLDPREEEYQRLLKALKDSRRTMDEAIEATPEELKSEQHRLEQERRESRARVDQWKDTINPILRNLNENDFDIHDYGSSIMEGMEVNQSKPFASIVDGKSSAEVVRYFIASLQLANTHNIEICGAKKGELSNDSLNVKLLKHDRYHEHLTEYQAPSEETFRDRLKRVRTMREEEDNDVDEPETKKHRLSEKSKRSRQSRSHAKTSNTTMNLQKSFDSSSQRNDSTMDELFLSRIEPQTKETESIQVPTTPKGVMKSSGPNPLKGKSIIKTVVPRFNEPFEDYTASSTSRQVHWPETSDFSCDSDFSATEESFMACLMSEQQQNPHIISTPKVTFD